MPAPTIDDLTSYIGATVSAALWEQVQAECTHRHGALWTIQARQEGDGWRIVRLEAKHREDLYGSWAARHGAV